MLVPGCHANTESLFQADPGQSKQTEEVGKKGTEVGRTNDRAGKRRRDGLEEESCVMEGLKYIEWI